MILAIETSCDDTSVSVVSSDGRVLSLCSLDQNKSHERFGGVVPEVASRRHTENVLPLVEQALREANLSWPDLTGMAVTSRPGLIGSLLVGVVTAKTLGMIHGLPFVGVNHIEGHLLSALLKDDHYAPPAGFDFPYLGLAVSGGHTHLFLVEKPMIYRLLGQTRDDAAGEAFDKFAKMLGLGFPGGVQVDQLAKTGDPAAFQFPRALLSVPGKPSGKSKAQSTELDFSFSGLKASAARLLIDIQFVPGDPRIPDLCASYQEAIVEVLVAKLQRAAKKYKLKNWAIVGGVSANSRLRAVAEEAAAKDNALLALPPLRYCTDNAAMIGLAGLYHLRANNLSGQDLSPSAASLGSDWLPP